MLLQEKINLPSLFYHQQGCLKKGQLTNLIFQDLTPFYFLLHDRQNAFFSNLLNLEQKMSCFHPPCASL